MLAEELDRAMRSGIYPITKRLAIGRFATIERARELLAFGYSNILNVSGGRSVVSAAPIGFRQIVDVSITDFARIPDTDALACFDALSEMLSLPQSRVFIHCVACQNRSPTIVWLFLVACGMAPEDARRMITQRCPDAAPGSKLLVDPLLVHMAQNYGAQRLLPLQDSSIIEPAY